MPSTRPARRLRSSVAGTASLRLDLSGSWGQPAATGVDAVLTGSVTAVSIVPVSFTAQQLASRYAITLTARVELRDVAADVVLWENPGLVYRQEFEAQSGQAVLDPSAFFGQDASALDRITTDFARSIVSAILEAF